MKRNSLSVQILCFAVLAAIFLATPIFADELPRFSLAWSEYPSWSTYGVAHKYGIINGHKGKTGPMEEKWGVDIVLIEADYDPCLTMYGAGQCDAVCITNMDALNPSLTRKSAAILPTSTSFGADACIVVNTPDVKALRGKKVYGLAKSVSEYCFVRNLEILGEKEADHKFTNMDPAAAALAMQQKQKDYHAIMVWNPFVLETLNKRKDAKVLFDSTSIPGEIIDMVVVAQSSLDKPGGEAFACALIETFYAINDRMANPKTRDETLVSLGEKFSNLDLASMKKVVQQTKFYKTPEEALALYNNTKFKEEIMPRVVQFCKDHEIIPRMPEVQFDTVILAKEAEFRFDAIYIEKVMKKKPEAVDKENPAKKTPSKK